MATDLIRYDVLVQNALRGVVRKVLADGAKDGLPGSHHFYISFDTSAPGLKISPRLKEMYPDEMTIVLQHQFWDLSVSETGFEVSLSFDKIPERLIVPFDAITGFFDPSVKFGLKFEAVTGEIAEPAQPEKAPKRRTPKAKPAAVATGDDQPAPLPNKKGATEPLAPAATTSDAPTEEAGPTVEAAKDGGAEVVSLDAFRKKK